MTRDEWVIVKEIAGEALSLTEGERLAYLAARCGSDTGLRREVGALLESVAKAEDLYETPVVAGGALSSIIDHELTPLAGARIGAYRVLSEIGRGGMGTAYLAVRDDQAYRKRVAIKLIKRGMDTEAILQRFRRERQILANFEHPNIVTLLDGGTTDDGLPYFVMEYVDGVPIDAFCGAKKLSIDDRLRLFRGVCGAVAHAHEHHILHRDLKPSNILVTAAGMPKLLDFGIAKLLDPESTADTGEPTLLRHAMTPQYASPEQIRGERLTTSSDIYSLGVVLYLLLAGRPPYRLEGKSPQEAERIVCDGTTPKPSSVVDSPLAESIGSAPGGLRRQLAGDLDAIVLTALNKAPGQRYSSASGLADDIQRYLDGTPVSARRAPQRRGLRLAAASALLAVILAASAVVARYTRSTFAPPRSIAVLPPAMNDGDPDLEYLSDGLTEDLIDRLSRSPQLKVIARDSAYRYKGKAIDPQEVGRALGVESILTGRMSWRGDSLSVSADLIDTRDGRRLWGQRYDRSAGELRLVQGDLARQVAERLGAPLPATDPRLTEDDRNNPEAYRAYLKGRYFWNKRTPDGLRTSITHFSEAVGHAPSFALAYAGLADSYSLLTEYHSAAAVDTYQPAKRAVERALALDPNLGEAHIALAHIRQYYEWDWSGAEREFQRGIDLNPHYATGRQWYAEYLSARGRHSEALAIIRLAQQVDPLSLIVNAVEANILYMAGLHDEAIEKCRKVIEMDANFPEVYEYLKRAYDQKGMYQEAIAARQRRRQLLGLDARETPALRAAAAATHPGAYWRSRVEQELAESVREGLQPFEFAELLAQAGDRDRALAWLERACTDHDFMMMFVGVAPNLAPLRGEERYQRLVRRSCRV